MIRLIDLLREDVIENSNVTITIKNSLPLIKDLGNKTVLTRTFSGIRSGAARVTTTPPKLQSSDPDIINVFDTVMDTLDFSRLVYCSHGDRKFIRGEQYIMVPGKGFRLAWSPQVRDLLVTASEYKKANKLDAFPYDSYVTDWPKGNVDEVLVDCDEYYLVRTSIPIVHDYMRKRDMGNYVGRRFVPQPVETYNQLYDILSETLKTYKL